MDKTLTNDSSTEPIAKTDTDYKAAIAQIFAELQQIDVSILQHQTETEKLRTETRMILAELKAAA